MKINTIGLICIWAAIITSPLMNNSSHSQTGRVKVASCQIFCLDGDRSGNFARIENALIEAKEKGAEIACFPETSLLGWVNPAAHERAFPVPGEDSDKLCKMAEDYNIFICIGMAEKEGDKLYDSVILIDDNGNIILKHRKINTLDELMSRPYTPGKDIKTVETRFGNIGMLICADTFKKEILSGMAKLKPGLMLIPYGWAAQENAWPGHSGELEKTVRNAAMAIGCPVVGTDLVGQITNGPWTGLTYGGASVICDENGKILATGKDRDKDVIITELSIRIDD